MKRSRPVLNESIGEIRDSLSKRFQYLVRTRAKATGMCLHEFREWVDEIVGEGIAVALKDIDKWDETRGDFLYWAFLKTRRLIQKALREERNQVETVEFFEVTTRNQRQRQNPQQQLQVKEQLKEILELLTRNERDSVILRYLHGFSVKEVESLVVRQLKVPVGVN